MTAPENPFQYHGRLYAEVEASIDAEQKEYAEGYFDLLKGMPADHVRFIIQNLLLKQLDWISAKARLIEHFEICDLVVEERGRRAGQL